MAMRGTEGLSDNAKGLDTLSADRILMLLAAGQQAAAQVVDRARDEIARASDLAAATINAGGKLVYAGAGSSGLMAMADALELPGTYGISRSQLLILLAGGAQSLVDLPGGPEDDVELARRDAAPIAAGDCVVCVSASGSTPYALAVSEAARLQGARVVAIANNKGAPLFEGADAAILLETPPELVAGSTRMGAGTAQKIALNMFSTLMAIRLGHVHDGHMVNLKADNKKLQNRAARIVSDVTGVEVVAAARHVEAASGSVKNAILLAAGVRDSDMAEAMLKKNGHNVRRALGMIGE